MKSLDILSNCEIQDTSTAGDLPSWVPDFRLPLLTTETSVALSFASSFFPHRFSFDNDILRVSAVRVATVTAVKRLSPTSSAEDLELLIRDTWQFLTKQSSSFLSKTKDPSGTFCSALCGGNFKHSFVPERAVDAPFSDCRDVISQVIEGRPLDVTYRNHESWRTYLKSIENICRNRSFAVTDCGYVGLAPLFAQAGDEVFVVLGCDRPLVLRPARDALYQVVGEVVIPEIQAGEAILGPLPEGTKLVNYYFAAKNYWYAGFWDEKMQQILKEDPRLKRDKIWSCILIPLLPPRYELLAQEGLDIRVVSIA